ncbi:MAG: hypothetical protein Q9216_006916 [Gyalolechia sp. 2 TL-2023]
MSRYSGLLERHRLQTFPLPPDKCMHILTAEQGVDGTTQVLYKKQRGSSGILGGGSFGAIHLEVIDSECDAAPTVRAVKTISKRAAEASRVHWQQEIENLIVLSQHPDLFVKTFGWWEDDKSIFLPMEYFEASDLSRNRELIRDEGDIRVISQQLALGLQQMHSLNIIHRDIKPHNVFVVRQRPTWHVKIGDFGFSKRVSDSVSAPFSARGTTKYMAPEYRDLMSNYESSDFTTSVDMWSLGCLIYELFAKRCPFDEDNSNSLMKYVRDGKFPRQPLDDCGASSESIWLIMNLLERDPLMRLNAYDALHCAWLNNSDAPVVIKDAIRDHEFHQGPQDWPTKQPVKAKFSPTISASSLEAPVKPTVRAPLPAVIVSDETQEVVNNSHMSATNSRTRPPYAERSITSQEFSQPLTSADDGALTIGETFHVPELPPRPHSSNTMRSDMLQGDKDRQLAIRPKTSESESGSNTQIVAYTEGTRSTQAVHRPVGTIPNAQILPRLRVTELSGRYIDMAFKNIKFKPQRKPVCDVCESRRVFNPVIKPGAVYYCKDCDNRPLCERCIRESFKNPADPHEADHKVQAWIQAHSFPLEEFLDRFQPFPVESKGGLDPFYGNKWLSSDHSFNPPAEGAHGTRWILNAPAGDFDVSVQVRIVCVDEAVNSAAIGKHKSMMVHTKAVPMGSMLFGARVIDPVDVAKQSEEANAGRHLPDRPVEQSIKMAKEEQMVTINLGFKLKATTSQKIEVHVRGSYDVPYFKAGSPFKWWLDHILLRQMGTEQLLASMGDLKVRELAKQQQAKAKRDKRIMQGVQYLGHGLGIAGKINGVRAASPSKQSNAMVSAVSAGLSFGGSMMKDRTSHNHAAAPSPVYNNYYYSSDNVGTGHSNQPSYTAPEYEEIDDHPDDSSDHQQQYLENDQDFSEQDSDSDWDRQQQ